MTQRDSRWAACVRKVRAGERISYEDLGGDPLTILASDLRLLLRGVAESAAASTRDEEHDGCFRLLQEVTCTAVHIDGGQGSNIRIISGGPTSDDPVLDFADLTNASGGPLPSLVLKNCVIEGWLDISGSHLTSLSLTRCEARGVRANACQIDGDCRLIGLRPLGLAITENTLRLAEASYCQVTMVAARIDGSVDLRNSLLRSPPPDGVQVGATSPSLVWAQDSPDQFALSLASSEIIGRLLLLSDFEAWGGISLFQTEIRNSVRITSRIIAAHEVREFPSMAMPSRKYAALDASEMRLEGNLIWAPAGQVVVGGQGAGSEGNVYGNVKLVRAVIGGDVFLQDVQWARLPFCNDGKSIAAKTHPAYLPDAPIGGKQEDAHASGGIDGRYCRIDGQLRIGGRCRIGRRYRPMAGLSKVSDIGPSLDFWKATFGLGVRLDSGAQLCGPVLLAASHIGRHIYIASDIQICTNKRPRLCSYHTALDLSDARLDGNMVLRIPRLDGRVSLSRMHVNGSMEIQRLNFHHKKVRRANYALKDEEGDVAHRNALRRERFDETSILDCQDLSLSGGINLKRDSISVEYEPGRLPYNRFIVDLRGTSCATWDDADCTCWLGLDATRTTLWTPWRLRFDGINFKGLDSSNQHNAIRAETTSSGLWDRFVGRFCRKRSYMVASSEEIISFRIRALNSFHDNRNRTLGAPRPETQIQPEPPSPGPLRRAAGAFKRLILGPSWQRREEVPDHSPQPYEVFARAYMARGEGDTAISLAMERVRLQWRRRLADVNRFWSRLYLVGIMILLGFLSTYSVVPQPWRLPIWSLLLFILLTPVIIWICVGIWRTAFGYGMHSGRALTTVALYVLIVAFGTPGLMGERIEDGRDAREHLLYALDKLLPVINLGDSLYPRVVCVQPRSERTPLDASLVRADPRPPQPGQGSMPMQVVDTTDPPAFHAGPPSHPCLSRDLDRIYDLLGWLVLSLSILTLSGLLRRDVDRPATQ